MPRQKIKQYRYFVGLNSEEEKLLREHMQEARKVTGEEGSFFASLLIAKEECKNNHGKSKAGRPRNEDNDDNTSPPFALPQEDTLSFTPEEIAKLKKKKNNK